MSELANDMDGSPSRMQLSLPDPSHSQWHPILHASNQVVLYNPTSHALSVQRHVGPPVVADVIRRLHVGERCPFCHRPMEEEELSNPDFDEEIDRDMDAIPTSRAANYFQLLQVANESSVPPTPRSTSPLVGGTSSSRSGSEATSSDDSYQTDNVAEGYFKAFFREECRLGMGANGSVFLCEHVLNGNSLGRFAVKKIAVGATSGAIASSEHYHLPPRMARNLPIFSIWPQSPDFTVDVLMQWAEGGSLDDFIDARLGRSANSPMPHFNSSPQSPDANLSSSTPFSRGARIRAFRAMQNAAPEDRARLRRELSMSTAAGQPQRDGGGGNWLAVHLLSAEEVKALFNDVVAGLAFLHDRSILHLDLKPGNVLLTWEQGKLIPKAMLSDFGTSQDMLNSRTRSGNTGTHFSLEYTSPESLPSPATGLLAQLDSKSDMWSLGMILHKLLFFRLPYQHASDNLEPDSKRDGKATSDALEREVLEYPGFKSSPNAVSLFESRHLPRAFLLLLEGLLNVNPTARPSSERVLTAIREGRLDPVPSDSRHCSDLNLKTSLIPIRRTTPPTEPEMEVSEVDGDVSVAEVLPEPETSTSEKKMENGSTGPGIPDLPLNHGTGRILPFGGNSSRRGISHIVLLRTLKSSILVAKVLSLSTVHNTSTVSVVFKGLALATAVVDTWFEDLRISVFLGLVHAGLLWVMD
ncbi:kinase-like protein [Cristinia sonorae]|uniref:Kinase-like protein n=1 Tax=Cristinia sonorae TaxID=1940300 RepID=A0A8K0UFY2_9AGAR|nr:kinase-like protein [Cristinia sonorae]